MVEGSPYIFTTTSYLVKSWRTMMSKMDPTLGFGPKIDAAVTGKYNNFYAMRNSKKVVKNG